MPAEDPWSVVDRSQNIYEETEDKSEEEIDELGRHDHGVEGIISHETSNIYNWMSLSDENVVWIILKVASGLCSLSSNISSQSLKMIWIKTQHNKAPRFVEDVKKVELHSSIS